MASMSSQSNAPARSTYGSSEREREKRRERERETGRERNGVSKREGLVDGGHPSKITMVRKLVKFNDCDI